jgi:hypothetical protein
MKDEGLFYKWLKEEFKDWHFQRIESTTGPGIPDVHLCANGVELWIELKALKLTNVQIRKYQYSWMQNRANHGGNVWLWNWDRNENIVQCWRFPTTQVDKGKKDHVKILKEPEFELSRPVFIEQIEARDFK